MIICLEGPDGAGKTTFARRILSDFTSRQEIVTLIKRGPLIGDVFDEYLRPLEMLINDPQQHIIMDRWHVGELIYGPLLRDKSQLTDRQAAYIELVMSSFGCHFVNVFAYVEELLKRWDQRPDDLIKREWLADISLHYQQYFIKRTYWVRTRSNARHTFSKILPSPYPGRYIGPSRPRVLLLGDVRGQDTHPWPFVPSRAGCGHWLMGALLTMSSSHMDIGIANANEFSDIDLYSLWIALETPPVVTLGRNAERAWRACQTTEQICSVPHPQYMRRFHYMDFKSYGALIEAAMRSE